MTRRQKIGTRFLLLAAFSCRFAISAGGHPSFTGTWNMDAGNSDFGMMPKVSSITDRITQTDAEVVINRARDGQDLVIHVPLDGSEKENDILGLMMKTTARWEGNVLMVDFSGLRRGNEVSYKERWTLAPDGKSFQVARHLTNPRGSTDQTLLMVKQ